MQEDLAYIAEVNSKLQEQITESSAKTEDESLKTALNVLLSKLDSLRRQMVISREGTGILGDEMLRERLGGLYSTVAELNGRPTDTHLQMLKAVEYDFKKTSDAQNVLLKKDLTILNELLQKAGLNKLVVLSREEFDKTESK
jgi:BMFP domain-containing protein YqiC